MSSSAQLAVRRSASAPGKILLAGEYVVLDGAQAVVMAIDRHAIAKLMPTAQPLSPFLAAVRDLVDDRETAERIFVDSSALAADDGRKLGLGSSAAATVAATACALGTDDPARVHAVAHRAHAAAQAPRGARGSGADIAASVHGGVVAVRRVADDEPLEVTKTSLPPGLRLLPVWTGIPADTPQLVARVGALRAAEPARYDAIAARIAGAAARLVDAFGETGSAERAVGALRDGGEAVAALGEAAGCALWTEAHDAVRAIADRFGAAVKPTGAGGGDVALVACADADAMLEVRARLAEAEIPALPLRVDPEGVTLRIDEAPPGA